MISAEVKYKRTGIEWMPQFPIHWKLMRLKFISDVKFSTVDKHLHKEEKRVRLCNYVDVYKNEYITNGLDFMEASASDDEIRKFSVKKGDILLTKDSETFDDIAVPAFVVDDIENLVCGYHLAQVRANENIIDSNFLFRVLQSKIVNHHFTIAAKGVTRCGLSLDDISSCFIPFPESIEEQKEIARILESESAKITRFIQTKQRFIDLLKEQRQSIIELALKSQENWKKSKIKHIAKMFGRIGFRGYQTSDLVDKGKGAITISPSNMKDNKMNFNQCSYLSWAKYEESPEIKIFQGDILFVKTGATYGKVALVPELPEKATINPQLMVFKELKIDAEYFCYYLQTGYIKEQVEKTVIGGTIPTISQTKVGTFQVHYPNPDEQKLIVEHIKTETRTLDIAISKAEREIELIKEYREAMIAEAVTGKRNL